MADPIHTHKCPRCSRLWPLRDFLQLPMLGVLNVYARHDGQVVERRARMRRCTCGQKLEQSTALG